MDIGITAFPAENGESLLVELYGEVKTNILIDLGYADTYKSFIKKKLVQLSSSGEKINLLVLTHYDKDHVEGAIEFFSDLLIHKYIEIEEIWINDFFSLCLNDMNVENINDTQKIIYEFAKFNMNAYRACNNTKKSVKISKGDIMTIVQLIKKLGYYDRVNKKFKNKIACIQECDNDNVLNLNNEAEIRILAPQKEILQKLLYSFLKWFEKNADFYKYVDKEELFELFISNLDMNMKDIADEVLIKTKTSSEGSYKELIDLIIDSKETFVDKSLSNMSSIVFSLKFKEYNILFTGDAYTGNIINLINGNKYDLVKIPHHGSRNNTSSLFLKSIECSNYLICTDGSGNSNHPDLETLVYIAEKENSNIYLNYPLSEFSIPKKVIEELKNRYNLKLNYVKSTGDNCIKVFLKEGKVLWQEVNF